jgi:DNA-binding CsgD family transcriptional regulator
MGRPKPDVVGVIEAAYRVEDGDASAWLARLVAEARPALDGGLGLVGYFADSMTTEGEEYCSGPIGVGCPDGWERAFRDITGTTPPETRRLIAVGSPVSTLSEQIGERRIKQRRAVYAAAYAIGMRDWLGIKAFDPSGRGLVLTAPLARKGVAPKPLVRTWNRVAAHLSAGYRLLRRVPSPAWQPDAILDAGRQTIVHAEGEARSRTAREILSRAARRIDRARGPLRRAAPEEAVSIWLGLVAGKWSLVEQEDRDGRRHLLARRNVPEAPGASRLTPRERRVLGYAVLGHPIALIAYALGLSEPVVATVLSRVQKKLQARSVAELVSLYRAALAGDRKGELSARGVAPMLRS